MSPDDPAPRVRRIASLVLRSKRPDALAAFYRDAFDFVDDGSTDGESFRLSLGDTRLCIERAGPAAADCPASVPGWSPLFQHFAIRTVDIDAANARLSRIDGWSPISTAGPEQLPPNTGSVTAFKFRDPDGHPLELIAFPGRRDGPLFAGIDHTAISVADVERSVAFYEALGFVVAGRTLNQGPEQARLDGLDGSVVDIVALRTPSGDAPHLELLHYRGLFDRDAVASADPDDVVATSWIGIGLGVASNASDVVRARDPDGHRYQIGGSIGSPEPAVRASTNEEPV